MCIRDKYKFEEFNIYKNGLLCLDNPIFLDEGDLLFVDKVKLTYYNDSLLLEGFEAVSYTHLIESNELWKGESFDTFKEKFDEWKMKYLKNLSEVVQLKEFIEELKATSELLIEQRDNLKNSLEV